MHIKCHYLFSRHYSYLCFDPYRIIIRGTFYQATPFHTSTNSYKIYKRPTGKISLHIPKHQGKATKDQRIHMI
jgi:hypothetical protein